jgi:hypothetical protein
VDIMNMQWQELEKLLSSFPNFWSVNSGLINMSFFLDKET